MHTYTNTEKHNLQVAEAYYQKMLEKNFEAMAEYLHNTVQFIGPMAEMSGKEAVVSAAKNFGRLLEDIQIRSRFAAGNAIMFAYDMTVPAPIGKFRASVLMELHEGLISRIELFYDARPFENKKQEIFSSQ